MGLIDDKKSIFTTIGAYTSVIQSTKIPDATNVFPSINNKKEIVPFLLDTLKVVVGTDALQSLTGELFTNFIDKVEPKMKEAIKKQATQFNAGDGLPDYFTTGSGIRVKVKDIDIAGKFKTPPSSAGGDLIYADNVLDFDKTAYDAIQNAGTETPFGSALLMKYDSVTDELIFKENLALGSTIGKFIGAYVDDIAIINKKTFISNVMNKIFGSITKTQGKTADEAYQELVVDKLIEQLVDDNDTFEISPEDNAELLQRAEQVINGVMFYDMGCGVMAASLPLSGLTNLINNISGSTDPFYVGNQIDATITESTKNNPEVAAQNKQTVKDGFFQRLIKLITNEFAKAMSTTPQIRAFNAIISAFQNNGTSIISQAKDDLKKFKVVIKCNIDAVMKMINEFIFKMVVRFLIALLNPVIRKIIKEKITQYSNIIKSLIPVKT